MEVTQPVPASAATPEVIPSSVATHGSHASGLIETQISDSPSIDALPPHSMTAAASSPLAWASPPAARTPASTASDAELLLPSFEVEPELAKIEIRAASDARKHLSLLARQSLTYLPEILPFKAGLCIPPRNKAQAKECNDSCVESFNKVVGQAGGFHCRIKGVRASFTQTNTPFSVHTSLRLTYFT
jgi:hypothetical protein